MDSSDDASTGDDSLHVSTGDGVEAAELVAAHWPSAPDPAPHQARRRVLEALLARTGSRIPRDVWLEAREGRTVVGALLVVAPWRQAGVLAPRIRDRESTRSARWLARYLRRWASIEAVVVRPDRRRRGVARALVRRAHDELRADPDRRTGHTFALAPDEAAAALLRSEGYSALPPEERLGDPELSDAWEEAVGPGTDGVWMRRHIGRRAGGAHAVPSLSTAGGTPPAGIELPTRPAAEPIPLVSREPPRAAAPAETPERPVRQGCSRCGSADLRWAKGATLPPWSTDPGAAALLAHRPPGSVRLWLCRRCGADGVVLGPA